MKEVKELLGNGVYVLCAECSANTHLIENKRELRILLNMLNNRLKPYLKIFDFSISPTSWRLIVQLKSRAIIMRSYNDRQALKENKGTRICKNVGEVMSETVRLLRSHFTNRTNILRGRKGNASRGVFKKYVFNSIDDARSHILKVRTSMVEDEQPVLRYRANRKNYDEDGQISKSRRMLNSQAFHEGKRMIYGLFENCLKAFDYLSDWFRECIIDCCGLHRLET